MAKGKSNFLFSNNPGDYSVYKMKGVEKMSIRSKGVVSLKNISQPNDPFLNGYETAKIKWINLLVAKTTRRLKSNQGRLILTE